MPAPYTANESPSAFPTVKELNKTPFDQVRYSANRTLSLDDVGKMVIMNLAGANNLTVPPDGGMPFPDNQFFPVLQLGAGQTTIVAGSGVTLRSLGGALKISGQYGRANIYKLGPNEYFVDGNLTT